MWIAEYGNAGAPIDRCPSKESLGHKPRHYIIEVGLARSKCFHYHVIHILSLLPSLLCSLPPLFCPPLLLSPFLIVN